MQRSLTGYPEAHECASCTPNAIRKQVPGHHIQVDVKFLTFRGKSGEKVRRFQYTAIDDATRVRALKVYEKHTQANAINFIDSYHRKVPIPHSRGADRQRSRVPGQIPLACRRSRDQARLHQTGHSLNSMVKSNDLTVPISRSSINFSATKATSIWRLNSTNGSASTTLLDRTAHTTARHLTKLSETSYSSDASVPGVPTYLQRVDIALSDERRILVKGPTSLASVVGLVQGLTA